LLFLQHFIINFQLFLLQNQAHAVDIMTIMVILLKA
jgi:hypothetical protein